MTVKLTRYNPTTNTFTVLGNIQCPAAYASTMPAPYNDGNYWSASDATTTPFYAAQLGSATYGDLVVAPDNTMYMTIGKRLIRIPNYQSITGTALIPSVEVGNVLPTGVGFNFTTQGPGTYGLSWDHSNNNLLVISSRTSDGSDGSYNVNPSTAALVGSFRVNCLATPTSANFADLSEVLSSIGAANRITDVQWLGYNNKYRITYNVRVENLGTSILKNVNSALNLSTTFPSLTISNVSTSFVSNPASLDLNGSFTGTGSNNLFSGTKSLYPPLYNGANLNGGAGNVTAGSNFAIVQVVMDVEGVATNGSTTYSGNATAAGTGFDATTVTDNSDNGSSVETGTPNNKADDSGESDATPIKFGSTVSGTVWNDVNSSAAGTFTNIFTTGESGTNAGGGIHAILIDPITSLVLQSVAVQANGTYTFTNIPSFANLKVLISNTAGIAGSAPPAAGLPSGWVFTSPSETNSTGQINTGIYNGNDPLRFGATDDINNDFGITNIAPTITATAMLTAFSACSGTASSQQSFTVQGSDLSAALTITVPAGYEVSTSSGSGFMPMVSLTPASGTVPSTTIYVRMTNTAMGTPAGNIICASTGATTQNVAVTGTVNPIPGITLGTISTVSAAATSFQIPYTSPVGSPNQYSITTGTPTAMPSFMAVTHAMLPASPISVSIPASAANVYNFLLTVRNSTSGCESAAMPFTLTVAAAYNATTNTSYATLQAAIDAANPMTIDTIEMLGDITEANIVVTNSVVLKSNGFILTIPSGGFAIFPGVVFTWHSGNFIFNVGATLANLGTLQNNGYIQYHGGFGPFYNEGNYEGTGTFDGNIINLGQIKPGK